MARLHFHTTTCIPSTFAHGAPYEREVVVQYCWFVPTVAVRTCFASLPCLQAGDQAANLPILRRGRAENVFELLALQLLALGVGDVVNLLARLLLLPLLLLPLPRLLQTLLLQLLFRLRLRPDSDSHSHSYCYCCYYYCYSSSYSSSSYYYFFYYYHQKNTTKPAMVQITKHISKVCSRYVLD